MALPGRQLSLNFFEDRPEYGKILAWVPLSDFLRRLNLLAGANVHKLSNIVPGLGRHAEFIKQGLIGGRLFDAAFSKLRVWSKQPTWI